MSSRLIPVALLVLLLGCGEAPTPAPAPVAPAASTPEPPRGIEAPATASIADLNRQLSSQTPGGQADLVLDGKHHVVTLSAADRSVPALQWVVPERGEVVRVGKKGMYGPEIPFGDLPSAGATGAVEIRVGRGRTVGDLARLLDVATEAGLQPVVYVPFGFEPCGKAPAGMRCVPGGAALVGGKGGDPLREIALSTFYVDEDLATPDERAACVAAGACDSQTLNRHLAVSVFCAWSGKRLPTELEWEVAARGGLSDLGTAFEWTSTRDHGDFLACGADCTGRDPLGPCQGARGCDKPKVVLKGGLETPVNLAHREIARESNGLKSGIRCVASDPWLTAFPPAWISRPLSAISALPAPDPATVAIFQGVADDAIGDKPICNHGEVGRSGLDCRDVQSYVTPNETRGHVFRRYIANLGGGYVGVASDQNYSYAAIARSEWVWLMDYDRVVVRLHQALKPLLLEAATPEDFLAAFETDAADASVARITKHYAGHPEQDGIVRVYTAFRPTLLRHYQRSREKGTEDDAYGWLRNDDHYAWIRMLHQQDRIAAVGGDMLKDDGALRNIGRAAAQMGVPIRIYYTSNAPNAWGGDMTPAYRANVTGLPVDDRSVVLQALGFKTGFGQTGYWHYNVFWAREYQRRLRQPGFDKHWKPVVDRIPSDDPDLTVNALPGVGWTP